MVDKKILNELKWNYNYNLSRYYKGCEYCSKHIDEIDKWSDLLTEINSNLGNLLDEIMKYENVNEEQMLKGFNIEE